MSSPEKLQPTDHASGLSLAMCTTHANTVVDDWASAPGNSRLNKSPQTNSHGTIRLMPPCDALRTRAVNRIPVAAPTGRQVTFTSEGNRSHKRWSSPGATVAFSSHFRACLPITFRHKATVRSSMDGPRCIGSQVKFVPQAQACQTSTWRALCVKTLVGFIFSCRLLSRFACRTMISFPTDDFCRPRRLVASTGPVVL